MFFLAKHNHIYTLNYNIKSLEQTRNDIDEEEEDDEQAMIVRASCDYRIVEDRNTEYCRIIKNIDDILKVIKEEIAKHDQE